MRYVLGAGIAGLLWAWHHREYWIVAEKLGGSMSSRYPIGPRYLHATPAVAEFVSDIGLPLGDRVTVQAAGVSPVGDPLARQSQATLDYMLKTRGVGGGIPGTASVDYALTSSHEVYVSPTVRDVTDRLLQLLRMRILTGKVCRVDADLHVISRASGADLEYESLVSTIPLPMFVRLLDEVPALGGSYVKVPVRFDHREILGPWPWEPCEYVYVSDLSLPFSRIARVFADGVAYACFEYPGLDVAQTDAPVAFGEVRVGASREMLRVGRCVASVVFPYGRVISRSIPQSALEWFRDRGIEHFGRFAEWQDHLLTHHLIGRLVQ